MDMVLKAMGLVVVAYFLMGVMSLPDFFILLAGGYLAVNHINIFTGAPLYT